MGFSPLIQELCEALRCLPGVGPKSAQRMALHLLERERDKALQLADCLERAVQQIKHCTRCNILCEKTLCNICSNPKRDPALLCIVESPADVLAIEHTASYSGYYFVLKGHLSPIDGIGPNEIGIPKLCQTLDQGQYSEVILATNPTVEGEATAYYIAEQVKARNLSVSRIAHGVPMGGELEYTDSNTLRYAFSDRKTLVTE